LTRVFGTFTQYDEVKKAEVPKKNVNDDEIKLIDEGSSIEEGSMKNLLAHEESSIRIEDSPKPNLVVQSIKPTQRISLNVYSDDNDSPSIQSPLQPRHLEKASGGKKMEENEELERRDMVISGDEDAFVGVLSDQSHGKQSYRSIKRKSTPKHSSKSKKKPAANQMKQPNAIVTKAKKLRESPTPGDNANSRNWNNDKMQT